MEKLGDGQDAGFDVHVEDLEEGLGRDLGEVADHAGGEILAPNHIGLAEPFGHQAGEIELDSGILIEDLLEVFAVDIENGRGFTGLNGGADRIVADQAHLTKDITLLQGGDGDADLVDHIDTSLGDDEEVPAPVAFADHDVAVFKGVEPEMLGYFLDVFPFDVFEERKVGQQVENGFQLVRGGLVDEFQIVEGVFPPVFQAQRAGATATGDHAVRDLVRPFVLNEDLGQVATQDLAFFLVERGGDDDGAEQGIFFFAGHGDGDAGHGEGVSIAEQRAFVVFGDLEQDFREAHNVYRVDD